MIVTKERTIAGGKYNAKKPNKLFISFPILRYDKNAELIFTYPFKPEKYGLQDIIQTYIKRSLENVFRRMAA